MNHLQFKTTEKKPPSFFRLSNFSNEKKKRFENMHETHAPRYIQNNCKYLFGCSQTALPSHSARQQKQVSRWIRGRGQQYYFCAIGTVLTLSAELSMQITTVKILLQLQMANAHLKFDSVSILEETHGSRCLHNRGAQEVAK